MMSDLRFAGVDWASEEHAVCVVDEHGRIVEGRRYRHNETGIRALCSRLVRLDVKLVALERPDGLLIDRLLDAGLAVIAVHLNQVKASRPRYRAAGGKSDGFDSFVLAELARTDSHRFRVLVPDGDQTKALRAMTRARESLVRTRLGLANQLRDQLATFWPGAPRACSPRSVTAAIATPPIAHSLPMAASARSRSSPAKPNAPSSAGRAITDSAPAFDTLADSSRHHNPWAADIYDRARARGASHPHAARILGRAWSQVIWRLWQHHDTYDPRATHHAATRDRRRSLRTVGPLPGPPSLPPQRRRGAAVTAGCPQGRARSA